VKLSPSPAYCLLACAVMLFSVSIVYVVIAVPWPLVAVMTSITQIGARSKSILRAGAAGVGWRGANHMIIRPAALALRPGLDPIIIGGRHPIVRIGPLHQLARVFDGEESAF
jgi:hypothetical protein